MSLYEEKSLSNNSNVSDKPRQIVEMLESGNELNLLPFKKELDSYEYRDQIFTRLERQWRVSNGCDLVLVAENGVEFPCHRVLLVAMSPFFACLDKYDLVVRDDSCGVARQQLCTVDSCCLTVILEYVYSGQINLDGSGTTLVNVLVTADYLLLDCMLAAIATVLSAHLSFDNVVQFHQLSLDIHCPTLVAVTQKFLVRNMYSLYLQAQSTSPLTDVAMGINGHSNPCSQLCLLTAEQLADIIRDPRLVLYCDRLIFFGSYFRQAVFTIVDHWLAISSQTKSTGFALKDVLEQRLRASLPDRLGSQTYRYVEPISRAYFMNSTPFGRHPPSLVAPPFNFRCMGRNIKRTFVDNPPHKWFIRKLVFYIIPDWNNVEAIGDIDIDYQHYWTGEISSYRVINDNCSNYRRIEVELAEHERIVKLHLYHGWLIYGMRLFTTDNRELGPYGSCCGELTKVDFQKDYPNSVYLHGFAYVSVSSRGQQTMNWLTLYGAMLDKEAYGRDFGVATPFEDSSYQSDQKTIVTRVSSRSNSVAVSSSDLEGQGEPTGCNVGDLVTSYPLPVTLEDLFYQWRRYMRLMRLAVNRRSEAVTMGTASMGIPGMSTRNISSPEFGSSGSGSGATNHEI